MKSILNKTRYNGGSLVTVAYGLKVDVVVGEISSRKEARSMKSCLWRDCPARKFLHTYSKM
jgi:hypothetical protein